MLLVVGYFGYTTWSAMTYWEDSAEKNTNYTNSRSRGGYGQRFYHK